MAGEACRKERLYLRTVLLHPVGWPGKTSIKRPSKMSYHRRMQQNRFKVNLKAIFKGAYPWLKRPCATGQGTHATDEKRDLSTL